MTTATNMTIPVSEKVANGIIYTTFHAATGALAAHLFTTIHPIGGAVFGFTQKASSFIISKCLDQVFKDTIAVKIVKFAIHYFGSISLGLVITSLVGYQLTFYSGAFLVLAMLPVSAITEIGLRCLRGCVK